MKLFQSAKYSTQRRPKIKLGCRVNNLFIAEIGFNQIASIVKALAALVYCAKHPMSSECQSNQYTLVEDSNVVKG